MFYIDFYTIWFDMEINDIDITIDIFIILDPHYESRYWY